MTLSKSQYIRGLQCYKSLWLHKHKPELKNTIDEAQESLFNEGNNIGELAKELFPGGEEVKFASDDFNGMVTRTKELIANGTDVIYEATFKENGIFVMADILVRNDDKWDMYEVKGSSGIKNVHIDDASIQWHALSQSVPLNRVYIAHINNQYIRRGKLEITKLFAIEDITDSVLEKQNEILPNLSKMAEIVKGELPDIDIGGHCNDPYACDFHDFCWKHISYPSVFDISYANGKQWELYYKGILKIEDIPNNFSLGANATLQIKHHNSQEIKVDKLAIKEFLQTIEYPINFFDFETYQNAIPRFDEQRPYAQMPFQYSLHILHKDGKLEHKEYLGDENSDPRKELSYQMLQDITPKGSIVAFNQSFEQSQIKNLALFCDAIGGELLALNERFVDLAHPFQYKHYYHPDFHGKYSIKVVLPTLFPGEDELDYKKLNIQNGGMAMDTFANLHLLKDERQRDEIRADLLAYCKLDTLAMVRIWERLHQHIKSVPR